MLLGGNQGNVKATIAKAMAMIESQLGPLSKTSKWYSTQAWGPVQQPDFINIAVAIHTSLPASLAMLKLLEIERHLGRKRDVPYGPRTIDIDMLYYGQKKCHCKVLTVPHPHISKRRFVLQPCLDIIPNWTDPIHKVSIKTLFQQCQDPLTVKAC